MKKRTIVVLSFLFLTGFFQQASAQEAFIGEIRLFAGSYAPKGWMFCHGQTLQIGTNSALFSIVGTTYGGDGSNSFCLPDLRGRVAVGAGTGTNLTNRNLGIQGGRENRELTSANLPQGGMIIPTYEVEADNDSFKPTKGSKSVISIGDAANGIMNINAGGGGVEAIPTMPPFQALHYIICVEGIFPIRQ